MLYIKLLNDSLKELERRGRIEIMKNQKETLKVPI